MNNKKRIFIGPIDIGGYYSYIAKELDKQGYKVTLFYNSEYIYQPNIFKNDNSSWFMRRIFYGPPQKNHSKIYRINKLFWLLIRGLSTPFILFWALFRFDVFIFGYGISFIPGNFDLGLLKKMGKRIIFNIAHGGDARPPYLQGYLSNRNDKISAISLIHKSTNSIKRNVSMIERFSDVVIGAPYCSHFFENKFVNSFALGVPMHKDSVSVNNEKRDGIRILHAPTHFSLKGTYYIREAIENLKNKGYKIDYIELNNVPHYQVLRELACCDFVVDQIFSDSPLAGFAAEAAFFSKAAVVGGYGLEELKNLIPKDMYPPSQICHPDNVETAIEQLITNEIYRLKMGADAQKFILSNWTSEKVTQRYIQIINNAIPESWYLNPNDIVYLYGAGLHKDICIDLIRQMIIKYGITSLQLKHRPDLEKAFVEFATNPKED